MKWKCRDHIKDSFNLLLSSVTLLQGENGILGSNPRQSNRVYPIYAKEKPYAPARHWWHQEAGCSSGATSLCTGESKIKCPTADQLPLLRQQGGTVSVFDGGSDSSSESESEEPQQEETPYGGQLSHAGQGSNKTVHHFLLHFIIRTLSTIEKTFFFSFSLYCYFCIEALRQQLSSPSLCPLFLNVFPSRVPVPTRHFKPKHLNLAALSVEDRRMYRSVHDVLPRVPAPPALSAWRMPALLGCSPSLPSPLFGGLLLLSELLYSEKKNKLV